MYTTLKDSLSFSPVLSGLGQGPKLRIGSKSRLARILGKVVFWHERARQRRRLSQLDERLLADMGLDRVRVRQEVCKPFWR